MQRKLKGKLVKTGEKKARIFIFTKLQKSQQRRITRYKGSPT